MKTIITNRLILRNPTLDDLLAFNYYASKPEVGPNAGWLPHKNLKESKLILSLMVKERNVYAIVLKEINMMIGTISLYNPTYNIVDGHMIEIGFVLNSEYWNKGIMYEALTHIIPYIFNNLEFNVIKVSHADFNERSKKLIAKLGFKYKDEVIKKYKGLPQIKKVKVYELSKKEFNSYENRIESKI